jgi:type IV secretory pathway VirB2 component (pilin)
MGGSESKSSVTTNIDKQIINDTELKVIKESISKNIMNKINEDASSCRDASQQSQAIEFVFGDVSGDFNLSGVNQLQKKKMNFSCVNTANYETTIAQDIANNFSNKLETKYDNDIMDKLETNASAAATSGALALTPSNSDSNVNTNYNLKVTNKISKTMHDIISNEVQNNFHSKNIQECVTTTAQQQNNKLKVGNVGGNVKIDNISQEQYLEGITKCVNENKDVTNTINKVASQLNNISTDGITTAAKTDIKTTSDSKAESKGVDGIIDSIFSGIAGIFGQWVWIIVIVVIGLVLILGVFFMTGGQETLQLGIKEGAAAKGKRGGALELFINNNSDSNQQLINAFKSLDIKNILNK